MREVIVADQLAHQQDDVVTVDIVALEAQNTFRICADREALRLGVREVVKPRNRLLRRLRVEGAVGEFLHGGCPDDPGVDSEAGRGGLKELGRPGAGGYAAPAA